MSKEKEKKNRVVAIKARIYGDSQLHAEHKIEKTLREKGLWDSEYIDWEIL